MKIKKPYDQNKFPGVSAVVVRVSISIRFALKFTNVLWEN